MEYKIGDRVAKMDSYYVGTIIKLFDEACVVEYDTHGRYLTVKRQEYVKLKGAFAVRRAQPYQEFHNAAGMFKDNVFTCFPKTYTA